MARSQPQPLFVVGSPHSGKTFLVNVLNRQCSQPTPFSNPVTINLADPYAETPGHGRDPRRSHG
jgi:hypothetical protein